MLEVLNKLKSTPKRTKIAKTLQRYIEFQEELSSFVKEERPETYVKIIAAFYEVVDFEIIEKLLEFSSGMAMLCHEFLKVLKGEPHDQAFIDKFKTQRVEFKNAIDIFMHNVQFVS